MSIAVGEAIHFTALTANSSDFVLKGGLYALIVDIGDIDSVSLDVKIGAAYLPVPSLQTAAVSSGDGGGPVNMATTDVDAVRIGYLPPGTYRLTVTGADTDPAAVVSVVRIQQ
jgi:hypothetical protein